MVTEGKGRDPLGLARVSGLLTDMLLPGIVVNTDRARYYAAYAWMLGHIHKTEKPKTRTEFEAAFQRREAAVAYATLLADSEASTVGKNAVSARLAEGSDSLLLGMRVLPSDALGGFGQYYSGSLYKMGLSYQLEDALPRLAPIGERIASAFEASISKTRFFREEHFRHKHIARSILEKDAPTLGLDGIHAKGATSEREALIDVFFELPEGGADFGSFRPLSLCRILHLLGEYQLSGLQVGGLKDLSLDDQLLVGPSYFGCLIGQDRRLEEYQPPAWLKRCDGLWRQFVLHECFSWALESVLEACLEVLAATPEGMSSEELARTLTSELFDEALADFHERQVESPSALLSSLGVKELPNAQACATARVRLGLGSPTNEHLLLFGRSDSPQERLAKAMSMLGTLYARWRDASDDPHWREVRSATGAELSAPLALALLDTWLAPGGWREAARQLLEMIAAHHDRVMYEKARLEACWLRREGNRYVFEQHYEAGQHQSRHRQSLRILVDLELVTRSESGEYTLSPTGRRVLARTQELRP
ncbi:hypothetical protein K8640_23740 [Myxococcus sp. XM-1-1-1]|uniref:hypothetical protein n=1 Tax=Myxococcus sp. XM-1-1-1 TaxID=2874602 RepID=UPI001CBFE934|nr:hypothetical protein [Myxococcus sp. XM-1-1-1]MBZ4411230.1 hypothetical protein [Myxococcus sp. XM-1-1-1]